MKKFLIATAGFVFLGLLFQGAAFAQRPTTGDRRLDSLLGEINQQAKADPEGFILRLSLDHGVPEVEIRQARERYGLSYGDAFMATVLSRIFGLPVIVVAERYKKNEGQGWGVMAKSMGIKPGSPEFKRMKANASGAVNRMKAIAKAQKRRQK